MLSIHLLKAHIKNKKLIVIYLRIFHHFYKKIIFFEFFNVYIFLSRLWLGPGVEFVLSDLGVGKGLGKKRKINKIINRNFSY